MVHNAYDSFELLNNCPTKIDAVESYGSRLFLACNDGSLRIYTPQESSIPDRSPPPPSSSDRYGQELELVREPYVLEKTIVGFSKKPLIAMQVLRSRELLFSLSDSIAFHRLPSLETMAVITKAKGANAYAWDDSRGFLCFARQKRVSVFRHDGGRGFVEVKEIGVPDIVKSMAWCGDNICLGIRREYVILNAASGAVSQVFSSGRNAPPLVVSLPSSELLLGKDNVGVLVDQNGKLLQDDRICWSEAPAVVVIQKPYAIALLPRYVEVRSLRVPYPLIQTVVLRNVRHVTQSSNCIIVFLDNTVYGLFPVPLGAQIVQLTASGNFEEALSLCKQLPPEDSSLQSAKECSIHLRYAHHLFDNGNYEEAMEHFFASQVDITYVLSLYQAIVHPKSSVSPEPDKLVDMAWDSSQLPRGSSGLSDDMESSSPPHHFESDERAPIESKKIMNHNTLMALIKFLQKKRHSILEKATSEGMEEVVLAAGDGFANYDSSRLKKSNKGRSNITISSDAREVAAVLDTALLQALLLTGQASAALGLLKGMNYCDVKLCDDILQQGYHYAALVELYKCNGMHNEALKLLQRLVEESKSGQLLADPSQKFKPDMIIEYLKPICGSDPMLVLEFSMLVLESCPTQTIELFLSGNIPGDLVNSYLKQHAPNLQATYLELMLAMNEDGISANLHNEMVQIYLSDVLDWHAKLVARQEWDEKTYSSTRKKLLSSLENISGYSPYALLRRLPADALYEERAILLGKMNQHELALSLYVHKLQVPALALAYCDLVYDQPTEKSFSNIYLTLLQIYLNPRKTTKNFEKRIAKLVAAKNNAKPKADVTSTIKGKCRYSKKIAEIEHAEDTRISPSGINSGRSDGEADDPNEEGASIIKLDEVLDLLSQRGDRINGAQALKLLPRETKFQTLLPFLGPLVNKSSEAYRNLSIIKRLRQSENLQVKDELYNKRKLVVKIGSDTMCSLCNKKIGTSVFAVYPNGETLVHFVCFRDSQTMKTMVKSSPRRKR